MKGFGKIGFLFFLVIGWVGLASLTSATHSKNVFAISIRVSKASTNSFSPSSTEEARLVIHNRHAVENESVSVSNLQTLSYSFISNSKCDASYYSQWHSYLVINENLPGQVVSPSLFGLRAPPYLV